MFENYREMSAEEKAAVKAAHRAIRAQAWCRSGNLAWGFVRGFPYRRIERATRVQNLYDGKVVHHNRPDAVAVTHLLGLAIPGFAEVEAGKPWKTKASPAVAAWLESEEGAVPAPVREKKPYVRPEVA